MKDSDYFDPKDSKGQSLFEFALILPLFLLMILIILDFGRAVYFYSAVYNAAREGARYASAHPNAQDWEIIQAAEHLAVGLNPAIIVDPTGDCPQQILITNYQTSALQCRRVVATYDFEPVTPMVANLMGKSSLTLRSEATMMIEPYEVSN